MNNLKNLTGGRELQMFLNQLPAKLERNVMRSALAAGARVIQAQAKSNAPVAPPNSRNKERYGGYAGALRDSIRVTGQAKGGRVLVSVKAGGARGKKGYKADVYYANFVEFGTAAHAIKPKNFKFLFFGGARRGAVMHPGAQARPFMRPAFDATHANAIVAVGNQIRKRLTKAGLELPDDSGLGVE